ncbi:glycoside hydrolase family 15 protein [Streptomyces sp. NBC_01237]|uniref:glycoside hydrolase family 15 protein n=1 Tax=Streptomyces sp. NBC_01237 TaxID=2903790 RepID=UPI002DDB1D7B|nr:glycoside hydrolase family 15 protein [Streptomyces sp. NBC_01237]WRZ78367.1 glycoside hydrolase family 15 protein [Streptomyces sp. NBC_01237]
MRQHGPARSAPRIEDYGLIGNLRTAALVDRWGSVDWMCVPRFDSPAVFANLLGSEEHGMWAFGPVGLGGATPEANHQRYLDGTLVLESTWLTPAGTVQILDFMPVGEEAAQLVRIARGISGCVPMRSLFRARPGYGRRVPPIVAEDGRARVDLGDGQLWLDAPVPVRAESGDLTAECKLSEGETVTFSLSWQPGTDVPPVPDTSRLLGGTQAFWRNWVSQGTYAGPDRDAVERSLITLKALQYQPTGAFVAAPTTSLPEEIGGVRNWDYRFAWLRDSALMAEALLACGYIEEARALIGWFQRVLDDRPEHLQIMYGVGGERELPEMELDWLPGFAGSAPVRIGNAAAGQLQIDVYGEVVDVLFKAQLHDPGLAPAATSLVTGLVASLETLFEQPDMGIWEIRGPRRHFVHSKIMAWLAFDRAVQLVSAGHGDGPVERWRRTRDELHREVCERGYDPVRNTFTQFYGSTELDAALLHIVTSGFLPPSDPRITGTVEAIQRELSTQGGFLLRYPTEGTDLGVDGLPGDEGSFLICMGWLITALSAIGRHEEAGIFKDQLLQVRNDLGLLAEEWDADAGRQLGNFPQGFSHIAMIQAILAAGPATSTAVTRQNEVIAT